MSAVNESDREQFFREVMDHDRADFWPDGWSSEDFVAVKITPSRVELSEMFGMNNKRVWRC